MTRKNYKSRTRKRTTPPPQLTYDTGLPIFEKKQEIIDAVRHNQVVIISGETGSGKTTQIPKFCIEAGRGMYGLIGCTQPRRIAAITIANRIAEELGEAPGQSVGHKIRFSDTLSSDAFIKIMTDGILLAETRSDPLLYQYDTIIVDEAHERSINIDFILGILRNTLKKRKYLKVIITSATIDTEKFSKAFNDAPIIEVSGRMYPVDVRYMAGEGENGNHADMTYVEQAVRAVDQLCGEPGGGDILLFMPTEHDIRETCEMIEGRGYPRVKILPLFARLSAAAQKSVFTKSHERKIIVATNVAETSITIPGIRFVIDTGLARISYYSPRTRTMGLPISPVSKSSADQRKGRCGRVADGVCIRLYDEDDFNGRPQYTPPEIMRANLADVILRMIALKIGDISVFPFIDTPTPKSIADGFDILLELGAIMANPHKQSHGKTLGFILTPKGKIMAGMPIDPRLSAILLEASDQGCVAETAVIVSALSIRDPRERPADKAARADQQHAVFVDPYSDFLTLLNIWNQCHGALKKNKSMTQMKKFCKSHFLSFRCMREWRDVYGQISSVMETHGFMKKNMTESVMPVAPI